MVGIGQRPIVPPTLDPQLRGFIDRAVVPALLERFLSEMKRADSEPARASVSVVAESAEQV